MSKKEIEDSIISALEKSLYIRKNHATFYKTIGKGTWLYQYNTYNPITDMQPIFVPQESLIMFINDIRCYKEADGCTESIVPVLVISRGLTISYISYTMELQ